MSYNCLFPLEHIRYGVALSWLIRPITLLQCPNFDFIPFRRCYTTL